MANEVHFTGLPGTTYYGVIHSATQVWRPATPAFENYSAANWANYATAIPMTEQGTSGYFVGSFPAGIAVAGEYKVVIYQQVGGSPAVPAVGSGDLSRGASILKWSGSAEIPLGDANVISIANDVITAAALATGAGEEIAEAVRTELNPELNLINTNLDAKISDIIGGPSQTVVVGAGDCGEVQYFDQGEKKPIGARLAATSGTFTISSVTVTLKDGDGTTVYGISAVAATGFDTGGLTSPRAWYTLDTVTPPSGGPIAIGNYEMIFKFVGTSSDSLPRTIEIPVVISVS